MHVPLSKVELDARQVSRLSTVDWCIPKQLMRCSAKTERKQHAQAEEELNASSKIWIGCAAAAVTAFCLFSGQYVTIGGGYEYEDDDDADDTG